MDMTIRNGSLDQVVPVLEEQHAAKYDLVAPSTHLSYDQGTLVIDGLGDAVISETGVTQGSVTLNPTDLFEDGVSNRLEIPRAYLRRMRSDAAEWGDYGLFDRTVSHWFERSQRNWFIRGFDLGDGGVARALLSDRYNIIDHIDALFATLDGIRESGIQDVEIEAVDLTERRMRVKITSPSIAAAVPNFVKNYRSPFTDRPHGPGGEWLTKPDTIYAGLVLSNSETGGGAFQIAPHVTVLVCSNGMTRTAEALRKVHLGERMDAGVIQWSEQTKAAGIELIKSQATDAVTTFLSQSYLDGVASELEEAGAVMLDKPLEVFEQVTKPRYGEGERQGILDFFVKSGDTSAAGVVQAVTAFAQTVEDPDRAAELEEDAFDVLAATLAHVG